MYDYSNPAPEEISLALSKKFSNELGAALRARRKALRWTQKKLAEESGVSRVTISSLENAQRTCDITTFLLLCETMGLRVTLWCPAKPEKT